MIWQLGMETADKVYDVVGSLPPDEKYGIRSQLTRSAVSIPANIAEGSAKRSTKEYIKYLEISQGSAFEIETHSEIVQKRKWVKEELILELLEMIKREQKMLTKFIEKVDGN